MPATGAAPAAPTATSGSLAAALGCSTARATAAVACLGIVSPPCRNECTLAAICCAVAVTSRKVRHANSLAIGANRSTDRPSERAHAASCTNISAPSTAVTASAMLWARAWKAPRGLSNWWRSLEYCTVMSRAWRAPPAA